MTDLHVERSQNTTLATLLLLPLQLLLLIEEIVDSLSWGSHCAHSNNLLEDRVTTTSTDVDDGVAQLGIFSFKDVVDNLGVALLDDLPSIVRVTIVVDVALIVTNYVKYSCALTEISLDRRQTDY